MDTAYSTVAIKYVGSAQALRGLDALRDLRASGRATLESAAVVTCSPDGEVHYYGLADSSTQRQVLRSAAIGLVVGLLLGRRMRWALLSAMLSAASGWFFTLVQEQRLAASVPFVEKNQSALYVQIMDADWPEFMSRMRPYLTQGLPVIQDIAPAHTTLTDLFAAPAEVHMPPDEVSAEPPKTGTAMTQAATTDEEADEADASAGSADSGEDDLTLLRGIGPIISERLQRGGVRTFAQLAALDPEAAADLAGVPSARVVNDDWLGQARRRAETE